MTNYEDYLKQVADLGGANNTTNSFLDIFLRTEYGEGYTYEGDLLNNLPHGQGILYTRERKVEYIGEWVKGKFEGEGKCYWEGDGNFYEMGTFKKGVLWGEGKKNLAGFVEYGEFVKGELHGKGKKEYLDKEEEGVFIEGSLTNGVKRINGLVSEMGEFQKDKLQGKGKKCEISNNNSFLREEGEFANGNLHGEGIRYNNRGIAFNGKFQNGEFVEGKELFIGSEQKIISIGKYSNEKLIEGTHYGIDGRFWTEGTFSWVINPRRLTKDSYVCKGKRYFSNDGNPILVLEGTIGEFSELEGEGKLFSYTDGSLWKKGNFKCGYSNNMLNGYGEVYFNGKLAYKGEFKDDELNGNGTDYFWDGEADGLIHQKGRFINGVLDSYNEGYEHPIQTCEIYNKIKCLAKVDELIGYFQIIEKFIGEESGEEYCWYIPLKEGGFFKNGVLHGSGRRNNYEGKLIEQGTFINGVFQRK